GLAHRRVGDPLPLVDEPAGQRPAVRLVGAFDQDQRPGSAVELDQDVDRRLGVLVLRHYRSPGGCLSPTSSQSLSCLTIAVPTSGVDVNTSVFSAGSLVRSYSS